MTTTISKEIEFDTGHRVPDHGSKCRHPHGHRYRVRVTCAGEIVDERGASDDGMLVDFGDLKRWLTSEIHDVLDHAFVVAEHDLECRLALEDGLPGSRVVIVPFAPTAEHLARWVWERLEPIISAHWRDNLTLDLVELWETPTSLATYRRAR